VGKRRKRTKGFDLREKLQALIDSHTRFSPHSFQFLVSILFRPKRAVSVLLPQVDMNEHDEVDETVVSSNSEENGVVDSLRIVGVTSGS